MIELGPSVSYVYKTEDGLNGFEEAQLVEARRMLNGDIPEAEEMDAMLGEIIGSNASRDVIREFEEDGKFLFSAVTHSHGTATPEGLLYADGTRIEGAPTFKAVKMGIWVVAEGVEINGGKMWAEGRERIRDTLLDLSFTDVADDDDLDWGVPVERTTIITPLHPQEGDISAPFAYGHRKDFKAIAGLAVPSALKAKITELVQAEHQAELNQ
jgi:hypothetical protein